MYQRLKRDPWITEIHPPMACPPELIQRYKGWKLTARQRGIECQMSMDEWWGAWFPHWGYRKTFDLVMARHGDTGPYVVGNIYFTTRGQNCRDGVLFKRQRSLSNC
jgi:hypothetical protein